MKMSRQANRIKKQMELDRIEKEMNITTIRVSKGLRDRIASYGSKNDSMEDILMVMLDKLEAKK